MDLAPASSEPAVAPPPTADPSLRSAFVAAVLGWVLPGLGQAYVGRPGKALVMFVAIGGLFAGGLALTAFTCVNPETYSLEFVAHAFLGGPTALTYYLTRDLQLTEFMPWFEVGRLYVAVAGLLNIVAICDALGDVLAHNRQARAQAALAEDRRRKWFEERRLAAEAAEAALARSRSAEETEDSGSDAAEAGGTDSWFARWEDDDDARGGGA
jgi:hypothetical protein